MIRVAVAGAGWVANDRYLPTLRRRRDVVVDAVFDRSLEKAQAAARAVRASTATASFEELLDRRPDVVFICTPPWTHEELSLAAFAADAHVWTEKPMAMDLAEATRMADAADDAGRLLCVSHNFVRSRSVQKADRALPPGTGGLHVMGTQMSSTQRRLPLWHTQVRGGLLFDEIPHLLYLARHYLGDLRLVEVGRQASNALVATHISLEGPNGTGQFSVVSGSPVSEWHLTVLHQGGVVDIDLFRDIAVRLPSDGAHTARDILRTSARGMADHSWGFITSGLRHVGRRLTWGHAELIGSFLDAIENGTASPVDRHEALNVVAVTDNILQALDDLEP